MMKEIIKIELDGKKIIDLVLSSKTTDGEGVSFTLEDGEQIEVSSYHSQECCEHVYADFSPIKYHRDQIVGEATFENITIKGVEDMGFLMCFEQNKYDGSNVKVFIPCYNYQNGYYSSDLSLIVKRKEIKTEIDISELVEDDIA